MIRPETSRDTSAGFIERWKGSAAAERANYQLYLSELCDFLRVPRPDPTVADDTRNAYVFERGVRFQNGDGTTSLGRIDLYKRGCFVLEAKQGSHRPGETQLPLLSRPDRGRRGTAVRGTPGWDEAMLAARGQAEQYAKALPLDEGWPPFIVVLDVGYSIELYSDFSRAGKTYVPFPDARCHRIFMDDLAGSRSVEVLCQLWLDPMSLDPSRRTAKITREVAARLAALAKSLESSGHSPETVAHFLMRCIFTAFAEDIRLLPEHSWTTLLRSLKNEVHKFPDLVSSLWETMNRGGFSPILREHVLRFNGGLFENVAALPVTAEQLELLIDAAEADWHDVEPAIFGTLLERALDPAERHSLGAHYTPRAYVERLVMPTIVEPLRDDWKSAQAAALTLANAGKLNEAIAEVQAFQKLLCNVRVLDPACGSGNFLYVTLEHLKRLEGEVLDTLEGLGDFQGALEETGLTVDPHQLLGLEVNPRAAAITDLVLWIGYLQWYFRTRGASSLPPEPVIAKFQNIECTDAVLAWDRKEPALDGSGKPVTQWDGRTMKIHPVTGEQVPDETARIPVYRHVGSKKPQWPEADFIVGNPPFIGNWRMRSELGDGYVEALRGTYGTVPDSAEYVMYWWDRAAELARAGKIRRFGFIATNSLRQTFNRRVVQAHLAASNPVSLVFAIPDHPWVDSSDGAAVRISMTAGEAGVQDGLLGNVVAESAGEGDGQLVELAMSSGKVQADLTIGPNVAGVGSLRANENLCCPGVKLHGAGFIVSREEAMQLGLGRIPGLEYHIREYRNGRDITDRPRGVMAIDLFGLTAADVREKFPEVFQRVFERVKPERDHNNRLSYRDNWWIFGEPRANFRPALIGLPRFISTVETAKHRFFVFLDESILPDNRLVNFALDDAYFLGVLSSQVHVTWALAAGGTLEDRPVYNKTRCFDTFPFPDCRADVRVRIRELAEALDAHRKRQQSQFPSLGMTDMYNVLEKLRSGEVLNERDRQIHEQGLVSVLRQLHDDLDQVVFEAYGWPADLARDEILYRLVALNAQRSAEEHRGLIRWVRPEYQNAAGSSQTAIDAGEAIEIPAAAARQQRAPWPVTLSDQVRAVRAALAAQQGTITVETLARGFTRARTERVKEILKTLVSLGQAREVEGRYVG
ncbi:MAG: DNA methyltransferase [Bryobacteraceae bacterium]